MTKYPIFLTSLYLIFCIISGCGQRPQNSSNSDQNPYKRLWTPSEQKFLVQELNRNRLEIMSQVSDLTPEQWNFKEADYRWSIAEIIEHLEVHDELFYRELWVLTQLPEMLPQGLEHTEDKKILLYAEITGQNRGEAPWYLVPRGRWCSKEDALSAYQRGRNYLIEFVRSSKKDFRKYITPTGSAQGDTGLRDLHQLMLISIAHSDRHLKQLKLVKEHPNFPKNGEQKPVSLNIK
ncbi:MAG: DinB family protein [Microscillaceae bacterium]|nr:DinB family protein [Microscillaceae bacterium]